MPDPKYFEKVKLLDGSYAEVYDKVARQAIAGGIHFLGVTSTNLTDGSSTNPITIGGDSVTAINGSLVVYGSKEFIFSTSDNKWHELGDTTGLGALALKDSVSATYTPAGTITKPNVTVTPQTVSVSKITNAGSVTPGTANVPTAVTLPTLTTTLNGTTLEFAWSAGSVTPGTAGTPTTVTLPASSSVTVVSEVSAALASTPAFNGTQATIVSE